jgi:hypothetical protein
MPASIRDPRHPAVMLWLSTLGLEERLTMLLALKYAFAYLENNGDWRAAIKRTCDELKPSKHKHEEIVVRAGRVAASIKADLGAAQAA